MECGGCWPLTRQVLGPGYIIVELLPGPGWLYVNDSTMLLLETPVTSVAGPV
jgi:hypothetical protein